MVLTEFVEYRSRRAEIVDLGVVPKVMAVNAPRNVPRVDYERIFVLSEDYELLSEYVLNGDCPLDFRDLRRSIPLEGLKHATSVFQGEYAFTPFVVDDEKFVILTRGVPRIEDRGFIGSLLAAARIHFARR